MARKFAGLSVFTLTTTLLTACGLQQIHYADTSDLEKPPALVGITPSELEAAPIDDSVVSGPEDRKAGMGDRVYLTDSTPPVLHIKQSFDTAWKTVAQAFKQKEIKITDHAKDQGRYFVAYDDSGFLSSFFKGSDNDTIYIVTLEDDGEETKVTTAPANKTEQENVHNTDGIVTSAPTEERATELLHALYQTMRDDLVRSGRQRIRTNSE